MSYGTPPPVPYGPGAAPRPPANGLYQAAAIINWIVLGLTILGTCGIGIIAAAWFIPMTIAIHKGSRDSYRHTALGVCTLLFCGLISGILILVADGDRRPRPTL